MAGNQDVGQTAVAAIAEILSAAQLPGSSILQRAADRAYERRKQIAIDSLIEAVRSVGAEDVEFDDSEADEFVQMLLRYSKAAFDGAAKQNLKLLAMAIYGLKKNNKVEFDAFQECANVLESLTHNEIIFLAKFYNFVKTREDDKNRFISYRSTLDDIFAKREAEMNAASLQRHGLLTPSSAYSDVDYTATSKLFRVCELASIEKL